MRHYPALIFAALLLSACSGSDTDWDTLNYAQFQCAPEPGKTPPPGCKTPNDYGINAPGRGKH